MRTIILCLLLTACAVASHPEERAPVIDAPMIDGMADTAPTRIDARPLDAEPIDAPKLIDAAIAPDASINDTCAHALCSTGTELGDTCSTCTSEICADDPYCCVVHWDAQCVAEVTSICGDPCL